MEGHATEKKKVLKKKILKYALKQELFKSSEDIESEQKAREEAAARSLQLSESEEWLRKVESSLRSKLTDLQQVTDRLRSTEVESGPTARIMRTKIWAQRMAAQKTADSLKTSSSSKKSKRKSATQISPTSTAPVSESGGFAVIPIDNISLANAHNCRAAMERAAAEGRDQALVEMHIADLRMAEVQSGRFLDGVICAPLDRVDSDGSGGVHFLLEDSREDVIEVSVYGLSQAMDSLLTEGCRVRLKEAYCKVYSAKTYANGIRDDNPFYNLQILSMSTEFKADGDWLNGDRDALFEFEHSVDIQGADRLCVCCESQKRIAKRRAVLKKKLAKLSRLKSAGKLPKKKPMSWSEWKQRGNVQFGKAEFRRAVFCYRKAIDSLKQSSIASADPSAAIAKSADTDSVLLDELKIRNNVALSWTSLREFHFALAECRVANEIVSKLRTAGSAQSGERAMDGAIADDSVLPQELLHKVVFGMCTALSNCALYSEALATCNSHMAAFGFAVASVIAEDSAVIDSGTGKRKGKKKGGKRKKGVKKGGFEAMFAALHSSLSNRFKESTHAFESAKHFFGYASERHRASVSHMASFIHASLKLAVSSESDDDFAPTIVAAAEIPKDTVLIVEKPLVVCGNDSDSTPRCVEMDPFECEAMVGSTVVDRSVYELVARTAAVCELRRQLFDTSTAERLRLSLLLEPKCQTLASLLSTLPLAAVFSNAAIAAECGNSPLTAASIRTLVESRAVSVESLKSFMSKKGVVLHSDAQTTTKKLAIGGVVSFVRTVVGRSERRLESDENCLWLGLEQLILVVSVKDIKCGEPLTISKLQASRDSSALSFA